LALFGAPALPYPALLALTDLCDYYLPRPAQGTPGAGTNRRHSPPRPPPQRRQIGADGAGGARACGGPGGACGRAGRRWEAARGGCGGVSTPDVGNGPRVAGGAFCRAPAPGVNIGGNNAPTGRCRRGRQPTPRYRGNQLSSFPVGGGRSTPPGHPANKRRPGGGALPGGCRQPLAAPPHAPPSATSERRGWRRQGGGPGGSSGRRLRAR
jgi:hypothetical protein